MNMSNKTHTIVVLSDGQTWNTLNGCSILVINDQQFDDLCADRIDAGDLKPISEILLGDATPPQDDDGEEDCNIRFSRADADSVSERPLTDAEWNEVKRQYNNNRPADSDWENLTTTVHNVILDSFEDENEDN
jgi:hypothetical protein